MPSFRPCNFLYTTESHRKRLVGNVICKTYCSLSAASKRERRVSHRTSRQTTLTYHAGLSIHVNGHNTCLLCNVYFVVISIAIYQKCLCTVARNNIMVTDHRTYIVVLLYGCESFETLNKLDGCYIRMLRTAFNIQWQQQLTNTEPFSIMGKVTDRMQESRPIFAGHCYKRYDETASMVILWKNKPRPTSINSYRQRGLKLENWTQQ